MSLTLELDGCALRTNPEYPYLDGINPYDHQLQTDQLFDNHDRFFGMNTAPTGGGKTISWAHSVAKHEFDTIAMYPRNSLISDQKDSLEEFVENRHPDADVNIIEVTGDKLNQYRSEDIEENPTKGDTLSRRLRWSRDNHDCTIMLTNPDIFVQMHIGRYSNSNVQRELKHFEVAVVDEFHICRLKERETLLRIFDAMYSRDDAYTKLSKVLFLSATPEHALKEKLADHMDVNFHYIQSGNGQRPLSLVDTTANWLGVVPPVDLELREADTFEAFGEMFDDEQRVETLSFCRADGPVLVMLDSVDEVNNTYHELTKQLPDSTTIHRITGFHDKRKGEKLRNFDVLVSNSAVEVGIDFDVDRIIFSAANASSLIQRIGRLRNKTDVHRARCYVPEDVIEAFETLPETPNDRITRDGFEYIVRDAHRTADPPQSFSKRYSAPEAYYHELSRHGKANDFTEDVRDEYKCEALQRIRTHYYEPYEFEWNDDEMRRIVKKLDDGLLEQLQTYRANSINTLVYDTVSETIRSYNPLSLIKNAEIQFVPEDQFYARLPKHLWEDARGDQPFTDGFCIYHGLKDPDSDPAGKVGLTPSPYLREEIGKSIENREPMVTDGLHISVEDLTDAPGLKYLNSELADREFICYPANGTTYDLPTKHDLDPFFRLYDLRDVREDMCVALGHNALYLHCHILDACENE